MAPRILGIDPGTRQLGWGAVTGGPRPALIAAGVCRARASDDATRRLVQLQTELRQVFELHAPDAVAVESSFFGKNAQALLRLGEARGMVIGLAGSLGLEVVDYTPA